MDGVASLVKVIGNSLSLRCLMSAVATDVKLRAFGAVNDVCNVVGQAVDLLHDVHLGLRCSF